MVVVLVRWFSSCFLFFGVVMAVLWWCYGGAMVVLWWCYGGAMVVLWWCGDDSYGGYNDLECFERTHHKTVVSTENEVSYVSAPALKAVIKKVHFFIL